MNYTPDWSRKSRNQGYVLVYCPDHPAAWNTGYVYEHRLVMEQQLGRLLLPGELVHHRNEDKTDNRPENLELTNHAAHGLHHHPPTGRTTVTLICPTCQEPFTRERRQTHIVKGGTRTFCSRRCSGLSAKFVQSGEGRVA